MPSPDDRLLTHYLLGTLPEEEEERLDEMGVRDDGVARRIRAVENNLVGAYARGEMSGETLARFKASYLASPDHRKTVLLARAIQAAHRGDC